MVKYTSLDAEKATVSATGLVTGVAEGEVQIKVTAGAFEQNVTVTVTPAQIEYVKTGIKVTSGATQTIYSGRDYVEAVRRLRLYARKGNGRTRRRG